MPTADRDPGLFILSILMECLAVDGGTQTTGMADLEGRCGKLSKDGPD